MTSRSYVMQKHMFDVMCHDTLLVGPASGHPGMKNTDVSHPGRTRTCYVTSRSHGMQKHKFDITCPSALIFGPAPGPPENEE
jgi:hypothetical protein